MNDHYVVDLGTSPVTTGPSTARVLCGHIGSGNPVNTWLWLRWRTVTWRWRRVAGAGDVPEERCGHSAVAVGRKVYLWGGRSTSGAYLPCDSVYAFNAGTPPQYLNHQPHHHTTTTPRQPTNRRRRHAPLGEGDQHRRRAHASRSPLLHRYVPWTTSARVLPGTARRAVFVGRGLTPVRVCVRASGQAWMELCTRSEGPTGGRGSGTCTRSTRSRARGSDCTRATA